MNNLRKTREKGGFTQLDLAKRADITPSDISKIENNKIYAYPGWRDRLAKALEVDEKEIWPDD